MTSLTELAARVAKLTGPDRETDCRLWAAFEGREIVVEAQPKGALLYATNLGESGRALLGIIDDTGQFFIDTRLYGVPVFTASVDAVLSLIERVLPGWRGSLDVGAPEEIDRNYAAELNPPRESAAGTRAVGLGPTPPLALLIALLEAASSPSTEEPPHV